MMKFRQIVYAKDEASMMKTAYKYLTEAGESAKYHKFLTYIDTLYNMREDWCLDYSRDNPWL